MRTFTVGVKDEHGDWKTIVAVELILPPRVFVSCGTHGMLTISGGPTNAASDADPPSESSAR